MVPIKKIDYRELTKQAPQEAPQAVPPGEVSQEGGAPQERMAQRQAMPEAEEKVSFFASLRNRWSLMDRKVKIEALVLIVVAIAIIGVVVFYFSNTRPTFNPEESYAPPAMEGL